MTAEQPDVLKALWPAPAKIRATHSLLPRHGQTSYSPIPTFRHPRVLVPTAVYGAERSLLQGTGPRGQLTRLMWKAAKRLPLRRLAVVEDPQGIEAFLSDLLAIPIRMGVLLGPPRANQKVVLRIFDQSGKTLAFAKLAHNPLTASLIEQEAKALRLLSHLELKTFRVAHIRFYGQWRDVPILVQSALMLAHPKSALQRPTPQRLPIQVMAEIAALQGVSVSDTLPASLTEQILLPAPAIWFGIDLTPVCTMRELTLARSQGIPLGSWHGDLGPWNMLTDGRETLIWDWERFGVGVPVGFDAAHHRVQRCLAASMNPADAWTLIVCDVEVALGAADQVVAPAEQIAGLYIAAICARYIRDAVDGPSAALRRRVTWLAAISHEAVTCMQRDSR